MNIKMKYLTLGSLSAFALLGMLTISVVARADYGSQDRILFSTVCQSNQQSASGNPRYNGHDCGTGGDGSPAILVPQSTKKGVCFYLTDYTAYNNNSQSSASPSHEVDFIDGSNSRATLPAVVLVAKYNSASAPDLTKDNWETPIVFHSDLWVDVHFPNNNIIITVSGFYDECPRS